MIVRRHCDSKEYNFIGDTESGLTMRWGSNVEEDPVVAPWPELADISISNYCTKGCDFCYRSSTDKGSFMSLESYEYVLDSLTSEKWGGVFQVALGGGEPMEHPDLIEILKLSVKKGVIANFTTNGIHITPEAAENISGLVGAVAVSANSINEIALDKIDLLTNCRIKTNLHFVLDSTSISDGIDILDGKYDKMLSKLNSVIFLTYKPRGRGTFERCLTLDGRLKKFLSLVDEKKTALRIGFDACFVPPLMRFTDVNTDYIDSCECGFFSIYIDENLNVSPCSFSCGTEHSYNLAQFTMEDIWNNKFQSYRNEINKNVCADTECVNKNSCRGKCLYFDSLSFCYK